MLEDQMMEDCLLATSKGLTIKNETKPPNNVETNLSVFTCSCHDLRQPSSSYLLSYEEQKNK